MILELSRGFGWEAVVKLKKVPSGYYEFLLESVVFDIFGNRSMSTVLGAALLRKS